MVKVLLLSNPRTERSRRPVLLSIVKVFSSLLKPTWYEITSQSFPFPLISYFVSTSPSPPSPPLTHLLRRRKLRSPSSAFHFINSVAFPSFADHIKWSKPLRHNFFSFRGAICICCQYRGSIP